ncbi:MAG: TonB-dependent receptor [Melioribacteraceae bacterium]|nr:TonB-dependent receptor [Melioribacteraceae bacterium]MCF8353395.1 TonB-dependent receptor [Melioribacteraceae bacterium]MCF8393026.1 TonB-dependent receptor [Melioribacteraceae bacterium]MCF8419121.1 TonB-dependent receptor [Melioribacteraceae bacterium]
MKKVLLFFIIISTPLFLFAQAKGKIGGKIIDAATGESLPGVNVLVKGTYFGAASDFNGEFVIENVTEGSYTVEASLIGYRSMQYTGVEVKPNKTTFLDIKMEESVLTLEQDVIVVGDKPLVDIEETQSKKTISKEEIELAVIEDIQDLVTQQAGVVKSDNSIHIRGGRSYENAFLLDGVSVQDPLSGTGFGLQLSSNAIEEVEVITGGFNAEFGQATSGIVNVRTREGSERFSGYISYKRDNFGNKASPNVFNIDIAEANFSGPEPLTGFLLPALGIQIPGKLSFFSSFYVGLSDGITQGMYKPTANQLVSSTFYGSRFAPRAENSWFFLGKMTYNISPTMKLVYSYNQSVNINQNSQSLQANLEYVEPSPGYQYTYQNILDNANTFTHNNKYNSLSWTHTLNSKTFYEFKINHFFSNLRADANGISWNQYTEPKDIVTFPIEYYNSDGDTIGVIPGDGLWDVGNPSTWRDHYIEELSFKGDVTSFFDEKNKFKAGFNIVLQEMQQIDIYRPWIGELGLNNDIYKVFPARGSFYAQDNINFSGMILNFGLRMDYWFPGKYVDDAVNNPDVVTIPDEIRERYNEDSFGWFGDRRFKARISPRLGISHPVTDNQILFFSYGHFSKWPRPQFVYAKLNPTSAQSTFQKFGNPNLNPETTVAYELGLKTTFTQNDVLTVTAYYKDIFDYVRTRTALIQSSRFANQSFITYANLDYARSRGLELEYKKRMGKWFTGMFTFSYAIVTGKSSSAEEGVLILRGDLDETIKEEFVSWDRPFTVSASLNFYIEKGEPLFGFAPGILDDINIYTRAFFQSGKRYTKALFLGSYDPDGRPEYDYDRSNRYSEIGDNWFWIDMNIEKYFTFGGLKMSVFVEVNNLLDIENSAIINPVTGEAYEYGDPTPNGWNDPLYPDLQAPISPYPFNPARYLTNRNVKFGLSLRF